MAVIVGLFSFLGTALTVWGTIRKSQAVTDVKIEELTREVRKHNNFAERMPVVEEKVETLRREIEELKHND